MDYPPPSVVHELPSESISRALYPQEGVGRLDMDFYPGGTNAHHDDDELSLSLDKSLMDSVDFDEFVDTSSKKRDRDPDSDVGSPKKKQRLKKKKEKKKKKKKPTLIIPTFDDNDFDDDGLSSVAPIRERAMDVDSLDDGFIVDDNDEGVPQDSATTTCRVSEVKLAMYNGLPLLTATMSNVTCRCIYASERNNTNIFQVLVKDMAVPYNFARQRWAIMARCDDDVGGGGGDSNASLSRKDEFGDKPPAEVAVDTQWFVLVGEGALRCVCSPFFTYKLTMAQFDPASAVFLPNKTVPVYRLFSVTEKKPLFSGGNASWSNVSTRYPLRPRAAGK